MKFKKEESLVFSVRITKEMRKELQKIADREKVSPGLIIREGIKMLLEQDRKDQEKGESSAN